MKNWSDKLCHISRCSWDKKLKSINPWNVLYVLVGNIFFSKCHDRHTISLKNHILITKHHRNNVLLSKHVKISQMFKKYETEPALPDQRKCPQIYGIALFLQIYWTEYRIKEKSVVYKKTTENLKIFTWIEYKYFKLPNLFSNKHSSHLISPTTEPHTKKNWHHWLQHFSYFYVKSENHQVKFWTK